MSFQKENEFKNLSMAYLCHRFFFFLNLKKKKKKLAMAYRRHRPEFLWNVQTNAIQDGDCPHSKQRLAGGRGVKRGFNSLCEGKPSSKWSFRLCVERFQWLCVELEDAGQKTSVLRHNVHRPNCSGRRGRGSSEARNARAGETSWIPCVAQETQTSARP